MDAGFLFGISARVAIAAMLCLTLFLLMRWRLPLHRQALHVYVSVGVPAYLAFGLVYYGAQYVSSGLISVLFGLTPIFTGLFAAFWLKELSLTRGRVLGILIGMSGLIIIFYNALDWGQQKLIAILLLLAATIVYSFGTVWQKSVIGNLSPFATNTGGMLVAAALFGITYALFAGPLPQKLPQLSLYSILYLAVFGSVFGAVLFYHALRHLDATSMAMLTLITPVTALFLGFWLNNEMLDERTVLGVVLILAGLVCYQWSNQVVSFLRKRI